MPKAIRVPPPTFVGKVGSLLSIIILLTACGVDRTFEPQVAEAGKRVDAILKARGYGNQEIVNSGGTEGGFGVQIHGIKDQTLLRQIAQAYIDEFNNTPAIKQIQITAYSFSVREDMADPFLKRLIEGPILDINMRRPQRASAGE
jgi:hypothetical protein